MRKIQAGRSIKLSSENKGVLAETSIIFAMLKCDPKSKMSSRVSTETASADALFADVISGNGSKIRRLMVIVEGLGEHDYYVDLVTGTLYSIDGKCITSQRLRVANVRKKPATIAEIGKYVEQVKMRRSAYLVTEE